MVEFLKHFAGKVCTIVTVGELNFKFKYEQMLDYFMGVVKDITPQGVFIEHIQTKCLTFIAFPYIVAITEEQVLREDDPEQKKIIEEYRKEKPITAAKTAIPQSTSVDPVAMAKLAQEAKERWGLNPSATTSNTPHVRS